MRATSSANELSYSRAPVLLCLRDGQRRQLAVSPRVDTCLVNGSMSGTRLVQQYCGINLARFGRLRLLEYRDEVVQYTCERG